MKDSSIRAMGWLVGENFFQDFIWSTGFLKKIADAFAQHVISEIVIEVAADADNLYLRIHFLQLAKDGAAPEAWQSPIEQDRINFLPMVLVNVKRFFAVSGGEHAKTTFLGRQSDQFKQVRLIFDDEDGRSRDTRLLASTRPGLGRSGRLGTRKKESKGGSLFYLALDINETAVSLNNSIHHR